jgi:hypothetical protein
MKKNRSEQSGRFCFAKNTGAGNLGIKEKSAEGAPAVRCDVDLKGDQRPGALRSSALAACHSP